MSFYFIWFTIFINFVGLKFFFHVVLFQVGEPVGNQLRAVDVTTRERLEEGNHVADTAEVIVI